MRSRGQGRQEPQERLERAPERLERAPERLERAPERLERAPERLGRAPEPVLPEVSSAGFQPSGRSALALVPPSPPMVATRATNSRSRPERRDRKSTRLNSSH